MDGEEEVPKLYAEIERLNNALSTIHDMQDSSTQPIMQQTNTELNNVLEESKRNQKYIVEQLSCLKEENEKQKSQIKILLKQIVVLKQKVEVS